MRVARLSGILLPGLLVLALTGILLRAQSGDSSGRATYDAPKMEYNHKTREIELKKGKSWRQPWIKQGSSKIMADRIFWNRQKRIGRCYDNVKIVDSENDMVITGGAAWHYAADQHSRVERKPVLRMKEQNMTVYAEKMHRYGKRNLAVALNKVRITTEDGIARGDRAEYDMQREIITLTGTPSLKQEKDVHRAEKIVLYQRENRAEFIGNARLSQGRDYVKADRIILIDQDRDSKQPQGKKDREERENRIAYYYGNVRIFSHDKQGKLESITSGGYGEYYSRRQYAKMMQGPKMVLVSDNSIINSSVMEQFRDENLAVAKGNVKIIKQYRTVSSQMATYYYEQDKIYLMGNPIIREYDDRYRADLVIYDTKDEKIFWKGASMAIVGVEDQQQKLDAWSKKWGGASDFWKQGQPYGTITRVVGDVFLSTSGKPRSNDGEVIYGSRAAEMDRVGRGTHIISKEAFAWCDIRFPNGLMLRLQGDAHFRIDSLGYGSAASGSTNTNATNTTASNAPPAPENRAEMGEKAEAGREETKRPEAVEAEKAAEEDPVGDEQAGKRPGGRRGSRLKATFELFKGQLYLKSAYKREMEAGVITAWAKTTNCPGPVLVDADGSAGERFFILPYKAFDFKPDAPQPAKKAKKTTRLAVHLRLPALKKIINTNTNAFLDWEERSEAQMLRSIQPGQYIMINTNQVADKNRTLATYISNRLHLFRSNLSFQRTNAAAQAEEAQQAKAAEDGKMDAADSENGEEQTEEQDSDEDQKKQPAKKTSKTSLTGKRLPLTREIFNFILATLRKVEQALVVQNVPERVSAIRDDLQRLEDFRARIPVRKKSSRQEQGSAATASNASPGTNRQPQTGDPSKESAQDKQDNSEDSRNDQ